MSTPQGTLVWSGSPTASQPVQPTKSPKPPTGSLSWTTSPTYSAVDDFTVPEDNRTTSERLRDVFGYTPNIKRQEEIASRYVEGKTTLPEMVGQSAMNTVGAFLAPVVKVVGKAVQGVDSVLSGKGKYNPVPERNLYTDIKKGAEQAYNKSVSTISESPIVQSYSNTENSKSFEEYVRGINDLLAITPLPKVVSGTNKALSAAEEYALQQLNKLKETHADTSLQKVVGQIEQVEKVGARSKTPYTAKDALITQKIAQSNVLPQTVDKTGTIDATKIKAAQQQYLEQPIGVQEDGSPITVRNAESVVGRLLEQEGAKANINEVINYLKSSVENSGLPADVMKRAIDRGVPVFAQALMKYADEFGNIALDKLHVEKIRTTSGLDYTKPLSKTYRKALASGLKKVIEKKSTQPIEAINQELGLHLEAVKRIGKLAGKKVEGGRLGTHVARGVGTGLGIVLGKIAGPVGATIGGAVGGEIGSAVQSAKMQRTFGKPGESTMPGSKLLEQASIEANKPKIRDLTVPDKAVGATKNIPKNKEILRIEKAIKDNVTAQKEAIKAKDFELVAKLKEVYDVLVEKLKTEIKKIKETPNKQGGFIGWSPSKSRKPLEPQKSERISSSNDTTDISNAQESLLEEAKKYETVEEFVNAQGAPVYHGTAKEFDKFDMSKSGSVQYSDWGKGLYLTPSKSMAKSYGNQAVRHFDSKVNRLYTEMEDKAKSYGTTGMMKSIDKGSGKITQAQYDELKQMEDAWRARLYELDKENGGKVMEFYLSPDAKVMEYTYEGITDPYLSREALAKGYDAVLIDKGRATEELLVMNTDKLKTSSQLTDIWKKAHSGADDLVNQAKKYATPEEFVKAQGTPVYRGARTPELKETSGDLGTGFYFTKDNGLAKIYAKNTGMVHEYVIDPRAKIVDQSKIPYGVNREEWATQNGYDGISYKQGSYADTAEFKDSENILIYNKDVIKTRSQLTEIWKKANNK